MERIVVTGLGVLSSIGTTLTDFEAALVAGKSGARPTKGFETTGYENIQTCEVQDFDPTACVEATNPDTLGRSSQFSITAVAQALEDAGLTRADVAGTPIPVAIGTTDGESQPLDKLAAIWARDGLDAFDADLIEQSSAANLANAVSREFLLTGPSLTISTACSAGNYAIGHALDLLREGQTDIAICGGSDSVCRKTYAGFSRLGTIAPEKCQPFDANRKGILTGEGAGILVLETLTSAKARGARIYAEVLGYGLNCDADHMVSPNMDSVANCIRTALGNAGLDTSQVDYICAHGTGTVANDTTETGAIRKVFGDHTPPVSSIKAMLGHTMGAASAIASIACILAIRGQFLPPTINHETVDADCPVDCVPNTSRTARVRIAQNNGFAFGGDNAITLFGAMQEGAMQ